MASAGATTATATASPVSEAQVSAGPTVASAFSEKANTDTTSAQPTSSQTIANSVLAGKSTSAGSADMGKLAAALGTGAGVQGNPIVVQLNERELPSANQAPGLSSQYL